MALKEVVVKKRILICVVGAIVVGVGCLPLLPWYLLGMGSYMFKYHEQKVINEKCFTVMKDMDPKVLGKLLKGVK
jgi:hypothetical protein